jgi:hypothetical protein
MTSRQMAKKLRKLAFVAAAFWDLPLEEFRINEGLLGEWGECEMPSGIVQMRLTTLKEPATLMATPFLQDTLAHELAHLAVFNHSKEHREFTAAVKLWIKRNWNRRF